MKVILPRGVLEMKVGHHRLVQHVDNLYVRFANAVVNVVLFSGNAVVAGFDCAAVPSICWVGGCSAHFIPKHAQVFPSLTFSEIFERVVTDLDQAFFRLWREEVFGH